MKSYIWPALGIILVTIALLLINTLTDTSVIKDYALLFIIAGMFLGIFLGRISGKDK